MKSSDIIPNASVTKVNIKIQAQDDVLELHLHTNAMRAH